MNPFPSKGNKGIIWKTVSYPADLLNNDGITVNGNQQLGHSCIYPL